MSASLFYRKSAHFGFDIGATTVKLVQIKKSGRHLRVQGYGYAEFAPENITEGIIVDPETIAQKVKPLLKQLKAGKISARRAVVSLPAHKIFTRTLQLPAMSASDLESAVHFEAEQYIPVPATDLYVDYEIVSKGKNKEGEFQNVVMVAAPRAIVDSYMQLFKLLNIEVEAIESSTDATMRAAVAATLPAPGTLLIDIGSISSNLSIYDPTSPLTGSAPVGGADITRALAKSLGISEEKAFKVKTKQGLSKNDMAKKISLAIEPVLQNMIKEARRVLKYYQERASSEAKIPSLILSGGVSAMPGIADYMAKELEIPTITLDPWSHLQTKHMPEVDKTDAAIYTTAIGLALRELVK